MSKAVRVNEPNITLLLTTIGKVLNGICKTEIERLNSALKETSGSINKIKAFLDYKGISYNSKTIETLRSLYRARSTNVHEAGHETLETLKKLSITVDMDDYNKALRILRSLKNCLVEMKSWFS
jgi:hypothetical protein